MTFRALLQRTFQACHSGRRPRQDHKLRPQLESLEDRTTPTILFTPLQPAPVVGYTGGFNGAGQLMGDSNPVVIYSIFWGSWWQAHSGEAKQIEKAIETIFSGTPYLQGDGNLQDNMGLNTGLKQYLDKPWAIPCINPHTGGYVAANNFFDPDGSYWLSQVGDVVEDAIGSPLGDPDDGFYGQDADPIYVVFTPPGVGPAVLNGGTHSLRTSGFFDVDTAYYAWVSTKTDATGALDLDYTTKILSREIVETMTDADFWGYEDLSGGSISSGEAQNYTAYLGGYLVQSYWSKGDGAYIIPDRQIPATFTQKFTVTNHLLTVNGGQVPGKLSDSIIIDKNQQGGVVVNLNGEQVSFDPKQVTSIVVNTAAGGSSSIKVLHDSATLTINCNGDDSVVVGDKASTGMQGINANVYLKNLTHHTSLTLDNGVKAPPSTVDVYDTGVLGLGVGSVSFLQAHLKELTIFGGSGGNTFNVRSTPSGGPTHIWTGTGANTVNVLATSNRLDIMGQSGQNKVYLGGYSTAGNEDKWEMTSIHGLVYVENKSGTEPTLPKGLTQLYVGYTPNNGQTPTLGASSITGVLGSPDWPVLFDAAHLSALTINGGGGKHTINIADTPQNEAKNLTTTVYCPVGSADTVNVFGTTGALDIHNAGTITVGNGFLKGFAGLVTVSNAPAMPPASGGGLILMSRPHYSLTVDDHLDTASTPNASLDVVGGYGIIKGLGNTADIRFIASWVDALTIKGGSGTDNFYIFNTPAGYALPGLSPPKYSTTLVTGNGTNVVGIFGTTGGIQVVTGTGTAYVWLGNGTLSSLKGWVDLSGAAAVSLYVDDHLDTAAMNYTVSAKQLTWQRANQTLPALGVSYNRLLQWGPSRTLLRQGPISLSIWHGPVPDKIVLVDPKPTFPVS